MGSQPTLSVEACWELLGSRNVGVLALTRRALPTIVPVQYHVDDDGIMICPGHGEIPERSLDGAVVALSVGSLEPTTRSGWFVEVLGTTRPVPVQVAIDCGPSTTPAQIVRLEAVTVSGRWMDVCPFISKSGSGTGV
jgi:hypothetical protein